MKDRVPSNSAATVPAPGHAAGSGAEARLQELIELKAQLVNENRGSTHTRKPPKSWLDPKQDEEVRTFIRTLTERKEKRKHQLSIVKSFLEDPLRFGLQTELVPSSTSSEEIEHRKQELGYRIKLLKTLLEIMEGEMQLLEQGEAYVDAQADENPTGQ